MISYDIYLFDYYSFSALLNRLDDLHIEVKKYFIYKGEKFYLKIHRKYRKVIKDNLIGYQIVDKIGFINFFEKLISKPITLFAFVLSICLFINLSNRIYQIEIIGDYPLIEESIKSFLNDNGVNSFYTKSNKVDVSYLQLQLKEEFNDDLEFIEVNKVGSILSINYKKRRKALVIEGKKGSLYATKDGVIKEFYLQSGVKNVKLYDFVKKGDLLVSDILITSSNESVFIGTIGKVFASTFYYVEVSCNNDLDDASKYAYMVDKARNMVSENLNSDDEYVESENILINDLKNGYMKIYYVLYEDITI